MTAPDPINAPKFAVSPINGAKIPLGVHPGHTGGKKGRSGRKKDELRLALRQGLEVLLPMIEAKIKAKKATLADLVKVAELQAKYGLGAPHELKVNTDDAEPLVVIHEHVQVPLDRLRSITASISEEEEER